MGEAIMMRSRGDKEIIAIDGYHVVAVTLRSPTGELISNYSITCVDGSRNLIQSTNNNGQTVFLTNSGNANIYVNNNLSGVSYIDFNSKWSNLNAPINGVSKININLDKGMDFIQYNDNAKFQFINPKYIDLCIVGGGGGGGSSGSGGDKNSYSYGGGAGHMNTWMDELMQSNTTYNFIIGVGGNPGSTGKSGYAGGTSYISGTIYSAAGGNGGTASSSSIPNGELGNGNGGNSPVDFAGGGGARGQIHNGTTGLPGGKPYGGRGGIYSDYYQNGNFSQPVSAAVKPGNGTGPGGGGGGGAGAGISSIGGWGYKGCLRLNIHYD